MEETSVTVTIQDDGVGFDVADVERPGKRRGLGLLSIRERVTGLRGTVSIESAVRNGSRIEVQLPAVAPRRVDDLDPIIVASLIDSEVNGG
jgi:signal transduction histidine kinase